MIPAGTGFQHHREAEFEFTVEEPEPIVELHETFDEDEDTVCFGSEAELFGIGSNQKNCTDSSSVNQAHDEVLDIVENSFSEDGLRNHTLAAHNMAGTPLVVTERRAGEEREFEIAPGLSIVMCWIPPGEFLMGSPEDEEGRHNIETQHRVVITKGYWLAKTPVTQSQWQAVMGNCPSHFKGGDLPVERVSWLDICGDESQTGGFLEAINRVTSGGERFDLPTEAQWEYACRAGTIGPRYGDMGEIAWYHENCENKTQPVSQKKSNQWGLHDMLGNVNEWCADWHDKHPYGAMVDPMGAPSGTHRVVRGGSWYGYAISCRAAIRYYYYPDVANSYVGFRIARRS